MGAIGRDNPQRNQSPKLYGEKQNRKTTKSKSWRETEKVTTNPNSVLWELEKQNETPILVGQIKLEQIEVRSECIYAS